MQIKTWEAEGTDTHHWAEDDVGAIYTFAGREYRLLSVRRDPTNLFGQIVCVREYDPIFPECRL